MGCPKNSTIAQRINLSKRASYKWNNGIIDDRAPTEAENSQKISNVLEINTHWIDNQVKWGDSGEEESMCTSSNSSSIVCLDRGDEEDSHQQISTNLNTILFTGLANWQKSAAEKFASSKWPRHYSRNSVRSMYRAGLDGPQAAWACKKYNGHRTLPPDALREARSCV